jgi:ketosteroid isomerase-like protein
MSQETIGLGERLMAAINAREVSDEVAEELLAPGYRIENTSTAVTDKTYYGAQGARDWISDFFEAFDEGARFEVEQVLADGDDYVVSMVRLIGHGARSGVPLVLRWVSVSWVHDGKVSRTVGYLSRRKALKAVGLEA